MMSLVAAGAALAGLAAAGTYTVESAGAATAATVIDTGGTVLSHRAAGKTGAVGVTFGFDTSVLNGGPYTNRDNLIQNYPLYQVGTAGTAKVWDNYVEELVTAGVNFIAADTRGYLPGSAIPNQGGDPRELTQLVDAINRGGYASKLKIAAFDDTPASMTDKKNQVKHNAGGYTPLFDMADTTGAGEGGYQYLWDYDLKAYFQSVPDANRYKVNGQPLVYLWSDSSSMFTNQGNGNSAKYLSYVRSQAQSTFGTNPYLVVDNSWLKNDSAVAGVANAADSWFSMTNPYTNQTFNGTTMGVTVPSFHFVSGTSNMIIDPNHGKALVSNLEATVNAGDNITLLEGFSDFREGAALWRTENAPYSTTARDYPSQDLNIMRRYSTTPFPTSLTVQAETADAVSDTTTGNTYGVYRSDNLDVQTTTDTNGGWNVAATAKGEWTQWNEVPLQGTEDFKIRVATPNDGAQIRFVVDGVAGPTITVPNTGGWQTYQTIDAGTFQFNTGTYHTVQLQQVNGGQNINWWQANAA